ncbi:MAG: hypothetical protein ACLFPL_05230 [Candidatus Nanoarchaeia archaeon]
MVVKLILYTILELIFRNSTLAAYILYSNKKQEFRGDEHFKEIMKKSIEKPEILKEYILENLPELKGSMLRYSKYHYQIIDGDEEEPRLVKEEFIVVR